jgi:hypothetical protein
VADLTGELRVWPNDTWTKVGVDPDQVAQAVIGCWQDGEVTGLQLDDLGFEEARSLTRPAMTYVRDHPARSRPPALATSHQRPPTRRPVPVATAPAGRTPDAAVRPRCPEPGRHLGRPQRKCPAAAVGGPLLSSTDGWGGHGGRTPTMLTCGGRGLR